jgi:indolepyruvate ferredoxin oxidoreductase
MKLRDVSLTDAFTQTHGEVYMTGNQALARLPMLQAEKDKRNGINSAGYITGYRGSPIGTYDYELERHKEQLTNLGITFQPGTNEDLAATAVWGTQQVEQQPDKTVDGVFSLWYAKAPGVFRSGDALKHGSHYGSSPNGGVLIVPGDDHIAKSSTIANYSDPDLVAHSMPFLYPSNIQEVIDYGLIGWALSRYSGAWVGLKLVNETIEGTSTVTLDPSRSETQTPQDIEKHPKIYYESPQTPDEIALSEVMANQERIKLVRAFARLNRLDKVIYDSEKRNLGIISSGKAYQDVKRTLELLGIDEDMANKLGITLYKVAMPWPLETESFEEYAKDHKHLLVVEEKQPLMESQIAMALFNLPESERPTLSGKSSPDGEPMIPAHGGVTPPMLARFIHRMMNTAGIADNTVEENYQSYLNNTQECPGAVIPQVQRIPWFCSGCPHNTSTKVPEGHVAGGGIGCHAMAAYMQRSTAHPTQMGGEGHTWVGMSHFVESKHRFQNLGDGTYTHSGLLAIHGAVAQKANITYKILYNDAVAMTGGQPAEGELSVEKISHQLKALGVVKTYVVTDEPHKYKNVKLFASGTEISHRQEMTKIQKELSEIPGVTAIIYDQTCAAEKRRRRKRGTFPDPARRIFINDAVCEACGDCSVQSNCMSIQTHKTELGNKRHIDQSSCNKDYSCSEGFCPSFVVIEGGRLRKASGQSINKDLFDGLPSPQAPEFKNSYAILINGIGGSGVVTIGAVLGMAAHLEGKAMSIYDMTGLAQKGGAVQSHLRIANSTNEINSLPIGPGDADLILGCDLVVSTSKGSMQSINKGHTKAVVNTAPMETAHLQLLRDFQLPKEGLQQGLSLALGDNVSMIDATTIATALTGDAIASNMFLVGFAYQKGYLPLTDKAIMKAVEHNGVAVQFNQQAFQLGRLAAHDYNKLKPLVTPYEKGVKAESPLKDSAEKISYREEYLTEYQNSNYAKQYSDFIKKISDKEKELASGDQKLSEAVALSLFKLMAYKDEYEVARLYSRPEFSEALKSQFEGDYKIKYKLAPPLLSKDNAGQGRPKKIEFGPYMRVAFKVLSRLKGLRGTPLDPFGYTEERKLERKLIEKYRETIEDIVDRLTPDNYRTAIEIAELPLDIRGYGPVKLEAIKVAERKFATLFAKFNGDIIDTVKIYESK